jgi:transcriptional regulator GlxA family with amidase domain
MERVDAPDRLRVILDLVEQSLDEPTLDGQRLADRAYLSRFHFDRLVASALGEPPGTFAADSCSNAPRIGWRRRPTR